MVVPGGRWHVLRAGHDLRFRTTISWVRLRSEGKFALRMRLAIWCASSFNNRCPVPGIAVQCQKVRQGDGEGCWIRASNSVVIFLLISCSLPSFVVYYLPFFFLRLFICVLLVPFFPFLLLSCLPAFFLLFLPELIHGIFEEYMHTLLCFIEVFCTLRG